MSLMKCPLIRLWFINQPDVAKGLGEGGEADRLSYTWVCSRNYVTVANNLTVYYFPF